VKYVIFLDIDGVLNSRGYFYTDLKYREYEKAMPDMAHRVDTKRFMRLNLDPSAVRNLRFLLEKLPEDKEIWISSSWGMAFSLAEIKSALKVRGLGEFVKYVRDVTPRKMSSWRCNEIGWALEEVAETYKGPVRWVSIDDNPPLPQNYLETVIYRNKMFKVEYNPEFTTSKQNGLTYTDTLDILTMLVPGFKPKMEPL